MSKFILLRYTSQRLKKNLVTLDFSMTLHFKSIGILFCLLLIAFTAYFLSRESVIKPFPTAYQGRFRPIQAYSVLWSNSVEAETRQYVARGYKGLIEQLFLSHLTNTSVVASNDLLRTAVESWIRQGMSSEDIARHAQAQFPLVRRLSGGPATFLAVPGRQGKGIWHSLAALDLLEYDIATKSLVPIKNFSLYSDEIFLSIQKSYQAFGDAVSQADHPTMLLHMHELASRLYFAYTATLAGKPYLFSHDTALYYPSAWQLHAEALYYRYPFVDAAALLYGAAASIFIFMCFLKNEVIHLQRLGRTFFLLALFFHTVILLGRCFILKRPPVSNMFETVLYVPWVAAVAAVILAKLRRNTIILFACSLIACAFLLLLHFTKLDSGMENVQAVLNSHYWLVIHVMMVVGSYGLFALSGILGHISLIRYLIKSELLPPLTQLIFLTMWLGIALLIPGTILGGVWAAQSWGRFWDWDPKESWAFITACVYLLWIHAYTFGRIGAIGIAFASIIGLQMVGFTWYGVNYLLGTGLHSYGFGAGGEYYFYLFSFVELLFLAIAAFRYWHGLYMLCANKKN